MPTLQTSYIENCFCVVAGIYQGLLTRQTNGSGVRGRGREELFWVLFHYMSGSLTRGPIKEFSAVLKLLTFYDEPEPLPVPNVAEPRCERKLAAALTYLFLTRKAQVGAGGGRGSTEQQQANNGGLKFSLPVALRQALFLEQPFILLYGHLFC